MNETLLGIHEVAAHLGVKHQAVRRLVKLGFLPCMISGQSYIFKLADVEKVKAEKYPAGMSHSDIAREYYVGRTTIIEQFRRLKVQPIGEHRGRNGAKLYDSTTVAKFALILGWDRRHKSPTNE